MQNNTLDIENYIKDHTTQREKDIAKYLLDYPGFSVNFFDEKRFDRFKTNATKTCGSSYGKVKHIVH